MALVSRSPTRSQFVVRLTAVNLEVQVQLRNLLQLTDIAPFMGDSSLEFRMVSWSLSNDPAVQAGTTLALVSASIGDATALFPLTPYGDPSTSVVLSVNTALANSQILKIKLLGDTGVSPTATATVLLDVGIISS